MTNPKKTIRIGILGGAFDPPHLGHIKVAESVLGNSDLDYIWLMPCRKHMYDKDMSDFYHRFEMCRIARREYSRIQASDYEDMHKLGGSTYDLINSLKKNIPDFDFTFIIGMDNALTFHKWYKAEELKNLTRFIVVPRSGYEHDINQDDWFLKYPHTFLSITPVSDSSTEARELLKNNADDEKINSLLDDKVKEYIIRNKLYA